MQEKTIDLRIGQWGESRGEPETRLAAIKQLLSMDNDVFDLGWEREPARLFSIDIAMLVTCRFWNDLDGKERREIKDSLQMALEPSLARSPHRGVWLTALNCLLPSPYRAAEATIRSALGVGDTPAPESFVEAVRQRLEARLGEGLLMADDPATLLAAV